MTSHEYDRVYIRQQDLFSSYHQHKKDQAAKKSTMKSIIAIFFISSLVAVTYASPHRARFQQDEDSSRMRKLVDLLKRADAQDDYLDNIAAEQQSDDYAVEQQDALLAAIESLPEEARAQFFGLIKGLFSKLFG